MSMPATAPESKHPHTATVDRAPVAEAEDVHQPFIPSSQDIPELTPVPLIVGALLGILFGASSTYLVLKVGLTVSAKEAKPLVYREGTACAEVLIAGEKGGTTAKTVFAGLGIGSVFALCTKAFGFFKDTPAKVFGKPYEGGNISLEAGPELLGVGYIIGTRIACTMGAGGILAALVLAPMIKLFGGFTAQAISPATTLIRDMSPKQIRA